MKLIKNALRTCLSDPFLEILLILGHCKNQASDACIHLAMNIFVNMKDRQYISQLSGPETFANRALCDRISTFVWGDPVTASLITAEEQRFAAAPGLNLDNERFSGGAFSKSAVYSRATQQMHINAQAWGKLPARREPVADATAVVPPPPSKRSKPNASAALPVSAPLPTGVFGVENIVDIKVSGKHLMYLVKWVGYDILSNSWEPAENILDPALIANFQRTHSAAHQAAMSTIARRKEATAAASTNTYTQQSPAEVQQQDERTNRGGRTIVLPSRFQQPQV